MSTPLPWNARPWVCMKHAMARAREDGASSCTHGHMDRRTAHAETENNLDASEQRQEICACMLGGHLPEVIIYEQTCVTNNPALAVTQGCKRTTGTTSGTRFRAAPNGR